MASSVTCTPLARLSTHSKRFAIKVRLVGEVSLSNYRKDGDDTAYISAVGVDASGDRVSLAFFNRDVREYGQQLVSGNTVPFVL